MPAEGRENPLLKKGNSDAFFREKYLTKNNTKEIPATQVKHGGTRSCGCKAMEHITDLRKQDITGERFGRLTAVRPTEQRDNNGSVIWELRCDCGNLTYKTVNALKSGRVLSCGCKYRETRSETVKHRRDMVEGTWTIVNTVDK